MSPSPRCSTSSASACSAPLRNSSAATSRVTILAYTMPIWSVLLAWPLLGERPTGTQAIGLGLCGAGLAVLIYPLVANGIPLGILLAIAIGVSWAAGTVYLKWARIDADPMGVASWQLTIAFVVIAACLLIFEGGLDLSAAHADALFALIFVGLPAPESPTACGSRSSGDCPP